MIKTFHRRNVGIKLLSKEKIKSKKQINLHTRFPVPMIWSKYDGKCHNHTLHTNP